MKIPSNFLVALLSWQTLGLAAAEETPVDTLRKNYVGTAVAKLSPNVVWQGDPSLVVDGDTTGAFVSYNSSTCAVPLSDLGFVTVDLGSSQQLSGIKVYGIPGQKYCNLHVNVWDTNDTAPLLPFPEPGSVVPEGLPAPGPGAQGSDAVPEPIETLSVAIPEPAPGASGAAPEPEPVGAAGASGQAGAAPPQTESPTFAPTAPPTAPPTRAPAPIKKAPPAPKLSCHICGDEASATSCDILTLYRGGDEQECPQNGKEEYSYCMVTMRHDPDNQNRFYKSCGTQRQMEHLWYAQSSDMEYCTDPDNVPVDVDPYTCHYFCAGDNCNSRFRPDQSLWPSPGFRKLGAADSNVYSTGKNNEFGPVFEKAGLMIPIQPARSVQYIRLWTGGAAPIAEVQPILAAVPALKSVAKGTSNGGPSLPSKGGQSGPIKGGRKGVRGRSSGSSHAGKGNKSAVSKGDPHFKTFAGKKFDFHGGCDLVLLHHPEFSSKLGLGIHIRTKINSWWSSIDSAVIRIGNDKLEVTGGTDGGKYWINGEPGNSLEHFTLSGFMVHVKQVSPKQKQYRVELGYRNAISFDTYKDFVSVNVNVKYDEHLIGSRGLMGSYPDGKNVARDGLTIMEDPISFGNEWQVLDSEPMLFRKVEGPQYPEACTMPSTTQTAVETRKKRRLGEAGMTQEAAEIACAHADPEEKDACVFDVLATQDKDMAGSY